MKRVQPPEARLILERTIHRGLRFCRPRRLIQYRKACQLIQRAAANVNVSVVTVPQITHKVDENNGIQKENDCGKDNFKK